MFAIWNVYTIYYQNKWKFHELAKEDLNVWQLNSNLFANKKKDVEFTVGIRTHIYKQKCPWPFF
jgi:hypothetical protein